MPYLLISTLASAIGFVVVYQFNPFWQAHTPLWWGMWLTLVVVPLYSASLLKQLHGAVRREQEASQAKSTFLANMSHELRTPLNGVIGVADLLSDTPLNKEQKEFAQIIRASANTLLELIDNVLDISRIEAGRIVTTDEDFDLHRAVNGTVAMMKTLAQGKGLALAVHIAPQTPFQPAWRCAPPAPDSHQPDRQCDQIHRAWPGRRLRPPGRPRPAPAAALRGGRHRHRHSRSRSGAHFRELHAGRPQRDPPLWRKRTRHHHRQATGGNPGRADRPAQPRRRGHDALVRTAVCVAGHPISPRPPNSSTCRCGWRFWPGPN